MSKKNKHFRFNNNNPGSDNAKVREERLRNDVDDAEILDDLEAEQSAVNTDEAIEVDVEEIENELEEDAVDSGDETVLPEDNVSPKIAELEQALAKEKKEYLFLMADFDNFRKRVMREKTDLIKNASEKVLKGLLPIVDDFERGLNAMKSENADVSALREGMELIYNKLIKFLTDNGVTVMNTDANETDFDAELHEAIASVPTGDESKKGKIIDTTQKGYMLNDKVLRHAKVVVGE